MKQSRSSVYAAAVEHIRNPISRFSIRFRNVRVLGSQSRDFHGAQNATANCSHIKGFRLSGSGSHYKFVKGNTHDLETTVQRPCDPDI